MRRLGAYRNEGREDGRDHLTGFAPVDRVVLDSVSGPRALTTDEAVFRRAILDLIRCLNDDLDATALFVAEEPATTVSNFTAGSSLDSLYYTTHGVIRVSRELVVGDIHRFVQIPKLRGVYHDTKVFELELNDEGSKRSQPTAPIPGSDP